MITFLIVLQLWVRMDICPFDILANFCKRPSHLSYWWLLFSMRILSFHNASFFILNKWNFTNPSLRIILPDVSHLCLLSSLGSCLWNPVLSKHVIPSSLFLTFFYCFSLKGWSGYSLSSNQLPINDFLLYPSQICWTYDIEYITYFIINLYQHSNIKKFNIFYTSIYK